METLMTLLSRDKGTLTLEEISKAVLECYQTRDQKIRCRYHIYFRYGLEKSMIDPNILLSVAAAEARFPLDLILLSLALRRGGNPNLYLKTPSLGPAHLTIYTTYSLREASMPSGFINTVLSLLVLLGSRTNSLAFDSNGGGPAPLESMFDETLVREVTPPVRTNPTLTAQDWLRSQGFGIYTPEMVRSSSDTAFRYRLAILADDISLISNETVPLINEISLAHSLRLCDNITNLDHKNFREERGQVQAISLAVDYGVSDIFKILVDKGLNISYFTINDIILNLIDAVERQDTTMWYEYAQMILHAVARGTVIDTEQMMLINTYSEVVAKSVSDEYAKPFWEKVCSGALSAPTPSSLKSLALSLNLDPSKTKEQICTEIRRYSEASSDVLKMAAITRHRRRAGLATATLREFIDGDPEKTCFNKTARMTDPFSYNDGQMAFYTSEEGQLWCFTSDSYEQLLDKKINPSTGEKLPPGFLRQIQTQLEELQMLGISPSQPLSTIFAIDSLTKPDTITDKESSFFVETIIKIGIATNVTEEFIRNLPLEKMKDSLTKINMEQKLDRMSPSHRLITFCRAVYSVIKQKPGSQTAKKFFGELLLSRA